MSKQPDSNKILAMDREHLREIDGVVLDLDSYARHTAPEQPAQPPAASPAPAPAAPAPASPAPVFLVEPQHAGWYETKEKIAYPIMVGAVPPGQDAAAQVTLTGSGSYVSSYLSSFATSFYTSWLTSYRYGSGSWLTSYFWGSGSAATSAFGVGGFGLELI